MRTIAEAAIFSATWPKYCQGRGKRGGVRVIYFNRLADGTIWLLTMYAKYVREDIDVKILIKIREMVDGKAQRKGTGKVRS
jgi:hypothetical protein